MTKSRWTKIPFATMNEKKGKKRSGNYTKKLLTVAQPTTYLVFIVTWLIALEFHCSPFVIFWRIWPPWNFRSDSKWIGRVACQVFKQQAEFFVNGHRLLWKWLRVEFHSEIKVEVDENWYEDDKTNSQVHQFIECHSVSAQKCQLQRRRDADWRQNLILLRAFTDDIFS